MWTNKLIFTILSIFLINYCYSQNKLITKIYFEFGFKNCEVIVLKNNKKIFKGILTSQSNKSGATQIVDINYPFCSKIKIKACGIEKFINIKKIKFYRVSLINHEFIVNEMDEEPGYVISSFMPGTDAEEVKTYGKYNVRLWATK